MMTVQTQESMTRVVAGLPIVFVFQSAVHYHMYFPTTVGVLKFNGDYMNWVMSEYSTLDELVESCQNKYPVYKNSQIFHNLDWEFGDNVQSLTNMSLADWQKK